MRVLAVTTNASLVVALGSMMRDWEVVTVRDAERAASEAPGAAVVLIDMGHTDDGVEVADQLFSGGIGIPCVVIGDKPADGARADVIVRPFSLEELGNAVREAASATRPAVPPVPREQESHIQEATAPRTMSSRPTSVGPRNSTVVGTAASPKPEQPTPAAPPPAPEPARRGGLSVVRPPEPPIDDEIDLEIEEEPEEREEEALFQPAEADETQEADEEAPSEPQEVSEAPVVEEESYYVPLEVTERILDRGLPERPSTAPQPTAPQPTAPQPTVAARTEAEAPGRWRRRKRTARAEQLDDETPEAVLVRRLHEVAGHTRELEALLRELPFLGDLPTMADGLAGEVAQELACPVASVLVRREDGYEVVGHRGLSRVEAGMVVLETQPLFSDVLQTGEGILIQPVDLAQGLVAGIGGSRTEAMMAAPAIVQRECIAIVVAGGDRFTELDLDRLSAIAAEAAPGIAVAELINRLRSEIPY